MIRSRLSYVRFNLRILTLLLPACSYFIAVKLRFGFNLFFYRTSPTGLPSYWGIVLLTTIIWAIAAEESGLWNVEQLYAPGGKSRRLLEALAFTYAVVMASGSCTDRPAIRDWSSRSALSPCSYLLLQRALFPESYWNSCEKAGRTK